MINLGDKVKDPITGIIGIAVAKTQWLHGCDRITVQPEGCDKEKKPFDTTTVDEPQLVIITAKKIEKGKTNVGGVLYTKSPIQK